MYKCPLALIGLSISPMSTRGGLLCIETRELDLKWIPDKCFPSIHLKFFMSDVMIRYIVLSRFTNLIKIYLVDDSWWCSNIHVLLDENNYLIQIYIIFKNWSISFISSTLLLSHISVAFWSTLVQFGPHWPCLVHFGLFGPFRNTYKSIWLK